MGNMGVWKFYSLLLLLKKEIELHGAENGYKIVMLPVPQARAEKQLF